MRWLILGAGAIGSAVGGLLAESGEEVWLLGRRWHLSEIARRGLLIHGILGEHQVTSCRTAENVGALPKISWDAILVTVKSFDTEPAAQKLPPLITPSTKILSLQNGLGNWEILCRYLPMGQVIGGRVIFGVELEPGAVTVTVWGGDILLGSLSPESSAADLEPIAGRLRAAGLPTQATPRIREALWSKVIYNCCLNPLSTLLEVPYGRLLENGGTRRIMREVVEEAYRVAAAEKLPLDPPTPASYTEDLFGRLIPMTAAHYPSMLQDIRRGRRTEIDALNGALVRLAETHRIELPVNRLLTDLIRARENFSSAALPCLDEGGRSR